MSLTAVELSQSDIRAVGLQPLKEGTEIIDFELELLSGGNKKLSDYRGQVVFLNFWATWCGPCRFEMPSMQELYTRFKDDGFVIVAVNLQEDKRTVQKFIDSLGLTFPVLLDKSGSVGATYGARSIPTSYIVDRNGYVIAGTIGTREWNTPEYIDFFQRLLEQ
jgi:peroxiredoxin